MGEASIHALMKDGCKPRVYEALLPWSERLVNAEAELEQLRTQAAGVFVPLDGWHRKEPCVQGDYGWSPVYQRAVEIRERMEAAESTLEQAIKALEAARGYLYNGFEPDNQSRAYHEVCASLTTLLAKKE